MSASSFEENVTQHRYIIIPADVSATFRTMRTWPDNRFTPWKPVNTDIEKTSHNCAKSKENYSYDWVWQFSLPEVVCLKTASLAACFITLIGGSLPVHSLNEAAP